MKDFLTDEEMAALEKQDNTPDFLTDEQMAKLEGETVSPSPVSKSSGDAFFRSIDPLGIPSQIGTYTSAAWEQLAEGLGREGIIPGSQTYSQAQAEFEKRRSEERAALKRERPVAAGLGELAGDVFMPTPGAALKGLGGVATRVAGLTGLAATGAQMRDENVGDTAMLAGGVTAGIEGIPYVGKAAVKVGGKIADVSRKIGLSDIVAPITDPIADAAKWVAKAPARLLGQVPDVEAERYIEKASQVRAVKPEEDIQKIAGFIAAKNDEVVTAQGKLRSATEKYENAVAKKTSDIGQAQEELSAAEAGYKRANLEKSVAEEQQKLRLQDVMKAEKDLTDEALKARKLRVEELKIQLQNPTSEVVAAARAEQKALNDSVYDAAVKQAKTLEASGIKVSLAPIANEIRADIIRQTTAGGTTSELAKPLEDFQRRWGKELAVPMSPVDAVIVRRELDGMINYGAGGGYSGFADQALGSYRKRVNDLLDQQLPNYKPIRDQLAELAAQQEHTARLMGKNPEMALMSMKGSSYKGKEVGKILEKTENQDLQDYLKASKELKELSKIAPESEAYVEAKAKYDQYARALQEGTLQKKLEVPSFPEAGKVAGLEAEKVGLQADWAAARPVYEGNVGVLVEAQKRLGTNIGPLVGSEERRAAGIIKEGMSNVKTNLAGKKLVGELSWQMGDANLPERISDIGTYSAIFGEKSGLPTGGSKWAQAKQLTRVIGGNVLAAPMDIYNAFRGVSASRFARNLEEAYKAGGKDAMLKTHFLLQSLHPDYRKMTSEKDKNEETPIPAIMPTQGAAVESPIFDAVAEAGYPNAAAAIGTADEILNGTNQDVRRSAAPGQAGIVRIVSALQNIAKRIGPEAYKKLVTEWTAGRAGTLPVKGGVFQKGPNESAALREALKLEKLRIFK